MDGEMASVSIEPMESLAPVLQVLKWSGFLKVHYKPEDKVKSIFYKFYRFLGILAVTIVNLQRIAFIVQRRNNSQHLFFGLTLEIPDMNLLVKYLTFNFQSRNIEEMYELLKSPTFAAITKKDEELLTKHIQEMHKLCKFLIIGVTLTAIVWPLYYFTERYMDETSLVPIYVPFNTDSWRSFSWCVIIEVLPMPWVGYGHIGLDCLVITFYAHAHTQLMIIKYNLEHLFDITNMNKRSISSRSSLKREDENDVKMRFVYYVKRYEKLVWFIKKIDSAFNISTSFQFFTSSVSLCMVTYGISKINGFSFQLMFLFGLLIVLLTQIFLYCYFGNLIQYESNSMNDAIYLSNWYSASTKLRRSFLIAMFRWSKVITPNASWIVPLTLTTFISITRFGYSVYALLTTTDA